jgi:molecular chaperone GrpE
MSDTTARAPNAAAARPEESAASPAPAPEATQPEPAPDPAAAAIKEAADLKDKLLRALAEMENLRRRTEREVADARHYGIASFARDMLAIADNMRRALAAVAPEIRAAADQSVNALIDGVELTERELLKALERHGVKQFDPFGEKFDPNLHQAMYEIADASVPAGSVVQVVQPGYMIGDRVLRPALVAVAKGGPKPAPATAATAQVNDNIAPGSGES